MLLVLSIFFTCASANFLGDADITYGGDSVNILEAGRTLTLSLDQTSGTGFQSKKEYLFGRFDMQLNLVPANSAGTVTTFYLSSVGAGHDEIDFEFLGNLRTKPNSSHQNPGKGDKEQQFRLWFNPTSSFHTYSILWNSQRIIFLIDNIPIRVYNNHEAIGTPFPKKQPMRVYCSLWNADDWATQGGRVKADWSKAPFVATYRNFNINACATGGSCDGKSMDSSNTEATTWRTKELDARERNRLRWVQQKHIVYNYCSDSNRFAKGFPAKCKRSRF
ncbi:hypothetical protein ACS0TY_017241 [Phlomoides rotata]